MTPTHVFSYEICEIFKHIFYRTRPGNYFWGSSFRITYTFYLKFLKLLGTSWFLNFLKLLDTEDNKKSLSATFLLLFCFWDDCEKSKPSFLSRWKRG